MNLAEFHFIRPYWLLALLPTIGVLIFLLKNKLNRGNWSNICDAELLPFILQEKPAQKNRWALYTGGLSSLLIVIALAGPTWERLPTPVFRNDAALVIALDLSRSMDADDIKPSRLSMARYKIADILKRRKDGQTALLVYAGDAFTVTPLTTDTETIDSQLSALTTKIMPVQGTNTSLALSIASQLLKNAGLQSGEILLFTDDIDFNKSKSKFESLADSYHISIIGVGTADGAPIKTEGGGFLKDSKGNIVVPKLNSKELSQLAHIGHGLYKTISKNNSDIDVILDQIQSPSNNKGSAVNDLLLDQWNEKGPWLLLLVLPLVALQFRKGLLSLALLCLLPFPKTSYAQEWNNLWKTQDQQAEQAFTKKEYQKAADKFQNPQWKAAAHYKAGQYQQAIDTLQNDQSATGLYNLGNTLALSGKLPEAIKAYKESLLKNPTNDDAKYNKELVEKELEKQQKQQQEDENQNSEDKEDSQQNDKDKKEQGDNKSNQSDEKNKSEQNQSENNSENNSEQNSDPEEPEQQSEEKSDTNKSENSKENQQKPQDKNQKAKEDASPQPEESSEYNESKQANEQWLKRIPDDPAGLLKRKFKYQYGQRGQKNNNSQAW
ncbi:MAG: VWA domain-containing protein [Methylococcales bacterium]|nr:VWA domain-containing protein [Methylococcales bacterium]